MTQAARNEFWENLARHHVLVQHGADILEGETVIGQRKSFTVEIADELEASEAIKLDMPCVVHGIIDGKIIIKDGANKNRFQNKVYFLTRFSVDSNSNPSIPASKEAAFDLTYGITQDFLNKLQSDYEDSEPCGDFQYIDENSYRWESIEMIGSNMCGWCLYFNDEENRHFIIDQSKWI